MRPEIIKISNDKPEPSLVSYAAQHIRQGEVLGMPTDTFYGLAADPFNLRAVDRVYEIKTRSRHKPLSLLIENIEQAEELARPLPPEFYALARRFWPALPAESPSPSRARALSPRQRPTWPIRW